MRFRWAAVEVFKVWCNALDPFDQDFFFLQHADINVEITESQNF